MGGCTDVCMDAGACRYGFNSIDMFVCYLLKLHCTLLGCECVVGFPSSYRAYGGLDKSVVISFRAKVPAFCVHI